MADAVTSQLVENGFKWVVYNFSNVSDGTGEAAVVKVDPTSTGPLGVTIAGTPLFPGAHLRVREIEYDVKNMTLQLLWGATANQIFQILTGFDRKKFDKFGGLSTIGIAGVTGKILFTTLGQQNNSTYSVTMRMTKNIAQ